jgi:hypothetical protein
MSEHVIVKNLPAAVQTALEAVGYGRADIEVRASETVTLGTMGSGAGRQAFAVLVNLTTGAHHVERGSWGGINMFERDNAVDNDQNAYPLPADGVAITGARGGGRPVFATLHVPASMVNRILPAGRKETLSDLERDVLGAFAGYTSAGRKEWLERNAVPADTVDGLVTRGLLKRNRAGATQITTDGKNAVGSHRPMYRFSAGY